MVVKPCLTPRESLLSLGSLNLGGRLLSSSLLGLLGLGLQGSHGHVDAEGLGSGLHGQGDTTTVEVDLHDLSLIHISEMAKAHVDQPSQVTKAGETVHVKVMEIDLDRRRVSLSMKSAAETLGFEIDVTPLPNEKKDDETEAEAEADAE